MTENVTDEVIENRQNRKYLRGVKVAQRIGVEVDGVAREQLYKALGVTHRWDKTLRAWVKKVRKPRQRCKCGEGVILVDRRKKAHA